MKNVFLSPHFWIVKLLFFFSQKAYLHFRENVCFSGQNIPSTVLCLLRWNRCNLVAHPYHSVFVIQKEIYPPEEECYVRLTFLTTFVELELSLNFSFFVVNDWASYSFIPTSDWLLFILFLLILNMRTVS